MGTVFKDPRVSETDKKLISDFVLLHDKKAFALLITRYTPDIRRVLFSVLNGNFNDMEEVEQEIFIALYHALPGFEFRASFRTWLYRFCRNKGIDFLRREASEKRRRQAFQEKIAHTRPVEADPVLEAERSAKKERVHYILSQLKEKDRAILVMKDMDGLNLTEIADILSLPIGTVKSRLHRARRKAAAVLEGER